MELDIFLLSYSNLQNCSENEEHLSLALSYTCRVRKCSYQRVQPVLEAVGTIWPMGLCNQSGCNHINSTRSWGLH